MDMMGYPRGLIRYSTEAAIEKDWGKKEIVQRVKRPRVLIYATVLLLASVALATSLWLRTPFKVDILRDRATMARLVKGGEIENVYRIHVMNATEREQTVVLAVEGLPHPEASPGSHRIAFVVSAEGVGSVREKSAFIVPR